MNEEIQPLGSRVLVRVLEEQSVTRSGIVPPDTAKQKPRRGEVAAVGDEMAVQVHYREFRFPVEIGWDGGRRTTARVHGKPPLQIATPPEFRGSDPHTWSPEDAFVAAAGSCLAVTIAALAEREQLPLRDLSINAEGVVGRRPEGRFGFVRIEQTVELETDPGSEDAARALISKAEDQCLVTVSLDLPVQTTVQVRSLQPAGQRS